MTKKEKCYCCKNRFNPDEMCMVKESLGVSLSHDTSLHKKFGGTLIMDNHAIPEYGFLFCKDCMKGVF